MVFSKKKGLHLNLVLYFWHLIIVTALKFLTFLYRCPKNFGFAQLSLPKKFEFFPYFGNLGGGQLRLLPPPGTAVCGMCMCMPTIEGIVANECERIFCLTQ